MPLLNTQGPTGTPTAPAIARISHVAGGVAGGGRHPWLGTAAASATFGSCPPAGIRRHMWQTNAGTLRPRHSPPRSTAKVGLRPNDGSSNVTSGTRRPRERTGALEQRAASETVSTYALAWLSDGVEKGRLRPLTALDYRRRLDLHILPTLGDVGLAELSRADVRDWHDVALGRRSPASSLQGLLRDPCRDELRGAR